jgi:uncharacterized protein (DUF924 family)
LDQFSRNVFRNKPNMFAFDSKAQEVCRHALKQGFDKLLTPIERVFVYLVLEHSENPEDVRLSVEYFERLASEAQQQKLSVGAVEFLKLSAVFAKDHLKGFKICVFWLARFAPYVWICFLFLSFS